MSFFGLRRTQVTLKMAVGVRGIFQDDGVAGFRANAGLHGDVGACLGGRIPLTLTCS